MSAGQNSLDVAERLRAFFRAQPGGTVPILSNLRRLGVGRSRENWAFEATWQQDEVDRPRDLILRRDPLGGLVETDRSTEFSVLRALEPSSIRSPQALWLDPDGMWFGCPSIIMLREPGACRNDVLNGSRSLKSRLELARRFCDLMAEVHSVRWQDLALETVLIDPGRNASLAQLGRWESTYLRDQVDSYPELELAIAWLRTNAPISPTTRLVHGDFKPGNILLCGQRITALLDWELAHLGDPHEDLGWVTQPLRKREHMIDGHWEREDLISRYECAVDFEINMGNVNWWNVFSTFKTAVMQVTGLRSFLDKRSDRLYWPNQKVLKSLLLSIDSMA